MNLREVIRDSLLLYAVGQNPQLMAVLGDEIRRIYEKSAS